MYHILMYINDHLHDKLTLEVVARVSGYSKWHFCDYFKQYTGVTFGEYLRHRRMSLAARDILNGNKILDVAMTYGYDTQGGFNKAFLSEYGCLPTEFKKNETYYRNKYEERRKHMYHISDRCSILRNNAVENKPHSPLMSAQRYYYYTKGLYDVPAEKRNNARLVAAGMASVIRNSLPLIQDGELIVGCNYGDGADEYISGDEQMAAEQLKGSLFTEQEIEWYLKAKDESKAYFTRDTQPDSGSAKQKELQEEQTCVGFCLTDNHSVIGYEKVLKLGFEGLLKKIDEWSAKNGGGELYETSRMVCEAACELGDRYAKKASELLALCDNDIRKKELIDIIRTCEQVPRKPARNFKEAVQSLWFAHIINTWEDGINANSLGRLDQILYPYYRGDIENGRLTKEEAFELISCLWIKLYRDYDVQQSCVGGCDADSKSVVNELSYMMLDATEELNFVRCLSVRYSAETPKEFIQRALEVVGHVQKGIPFFFNDDVMIPALVSHGITPEDAAGYTQIGCVETVIPGKSNPHAVTGRANLLKAIEYALANGQSMLKPELCPGIETGDPLRFRHYSALKEAVFAQIRHIIRNTCELVAQSLPAGTANAPKPYKSLLTEGCMESGKDFNDKGAIYDYYQIMLMGIPNLADSMQAAKELVYWQNRFSMKELIYQLQNNFPDEAFRLDCVNKAPKFGNDIDEVDDIAKEIMDYSCDCLDELSVEFGIRFHAQPFTFLWMVDHGNLTAATPDGRRNGEILAYSVSPMQGRDFNGFTSLMNSLSKLPTHKAPGTTSAIVEVDPMLFTDKNIRTFADILIASAKKGLCNVQFNTIDVDTLIDAQRHPEKYRNLAVRVSGFSQKFYLLDKSMQDHIIGRTKHKSL